MKVNTEKSRVEDWAKSYNESPFGFNFVGMPDQPRLRDYIKCCNVMLVGEMGVGKELWTDSFALELKCEPADILRVNCAALPPRGSDACAWLFGYAKGSFTGGSPHGSKGLLGSLSEKNEALIFLDEIGKMPREAQGLLLRLVQFRVLQMFGGPERQPKGKWRIVCAAHDTTDCIPDLVARCTTVRIPALRYDVHGLLHMLTAGLVKRQVSLDMNVNERVLWHLLSRRWPGNRREFDAYLDSNVYSPDAIGSDGSMHNNQCRKLFAPFPEYLLPGCDPNDLDKRIDPAEEFVAKSMFGTGGMVPWPRGNELWHPRACGRKEYELAGLNTERFTGLEVPEKNRREKILKLWQVWDYDPPRNTCEGRVFSAGDWYEVYDNWASIFERRRALMIEAWEQARKDQYYERARRVVGRALDEQSRTAGICKNNFADWVHKWIAQGNPATVTVMAKFVGKTPQTLYDWGVKKIIATLNKEKGKGK